MLLNLKIINETIKAYQLEGNGWIPKSVLDSRGLKHPYYQVKNWWLETFMTKGMEGNFTQQEKETIFSLSKCKIIFKDLPEDVLNYWKKYWKDASDSLPPLKITSQNRKKLSHSLDHYNDIGAMNDLTFQDVYGDFGY
jgi:hypothetical protein